MQKRTNNKVQMRNQTGISLLEVLAALVILSMGATVAFTWLNQNLALMSRLKIEESSLMARFEALEIARSINPESSPQGTVPMEYYTLHWVSYPIAPKQRSLNSKGGEGRYEITLHKADFEVIDPVEKKSIFKFNIKLAGYREIAGSGFTW